MVPANDEAHVRRWWMMVIGCGLAAAFVIPAQAAPAQTELQKVLGRIKVTYHKLISYSADYTRLTKSQTMGPTGPTTRIVKATGKIYFARFGKPGRWGRMMVRLDQEGPREEKLMSDGVKLWWYRPWQQRAYEYTVTRHSGSLRPVLDFLQGLSGLENSFRIQWHREKKLAPDLYAIIIEPKNPRPDLKYMVFYLNKKDLILRGFLMVNFMGTRTEYTFTKIDTTRKLQPSFFRFKRPRGVKIIRQRTAPR
jgi:outer membrane lipoprotein-sorting protein